MYAICIGALFWGMDRHPLQCYIVAAVYDNVVELAVERCKAIDHHIF